MEMATSNYDPKHVLPLRTKLNMTQTELAESVGVSQPTVALWEAGHRRPSGAAAILLKQLEKKTEKKSRRQT
jgi:DNA-binding transcriptional regulator YiaG